MIQISRSDAEKFEVSCLLNPALRTIWSGWGSINLPNCWMVAGCLAQTVWNIRFGLPADHGISDLDLVYFDPDDLSLSSEQRQAERIRTMFPGLPVWIDVKNEARVHLWYEEKFGYPISPYRSVTDAIDTFPTTATAVGIRPVGGSAEIYASFGLSDLLDGVVRANRKQINRDIYEAKISKWRRKWPHLNIVKWSNNS